MAAKRVASSSINWTAFRETVPKSDLPYFQALKARSDSYLKKVAAQPESLPKIDWNYYKSRITVPGMVDNFQKSYEGLNIPYPTDKGLLAKIEEQEKTANAEFAKFTKEMEGTINELKEKLKALESEIAYSDMTIEEFYLANPDQAIDPVKFPTFYPHGPEQIEFTKKLIESGKL
ncbi:UNVERIFIED_CONTAM: hypothetical protein PYX00_007841 [Menopon gallinae]|uniref:ATP synthase subunit d, mitochondrial n=1 Tax=Menopon gallinae TaxID=328185 RepID=A0AAW2HLT6_9NEOP